MSLKSNVKEIKKIINESNKSVEELESEAFTFNNKELNDNQKILYVFDKISLEVKPDNKYYDWFLTSILELKDDVYYILGGQDNEEDVCYTNTVKKMLTYLSCELGLDPSFYKSFDSMVKNNEFNLSYPHLRDNNDYNTIFNRFYRTEVLEKRGIKELSWDVAYELASNYYNEYGSLEMPNNYKTFDGINIDPNGYNLNKWISSQRSKYFKGYLSEDKIKKLLDIGMVFENKKNSTLKMNKK